MVRLVYSNRTEELLAELARRVRAQQLRDGPLVPISIVVPSAGVDGYVRRGIARQCGIAANLDVSLLTRFAAALVATATGATVADAAHIEAMVLTLLLDEEALAAPELEPVREYLHSAGAATDAVDFRRVQLAARLGRLFEEYTYSRGDMLSAWQDGLLLDGGRADAFRTPPGRARAENSGEEVWQRSLWLAMFEPGGLADQRAHAGHARVLPLPSAVAAIDPPAAALPRTIHVFAFAHVARTFHQLFARLASIVEVVVYTLTPCEGFWEDVDDREPEPLRLWARPGREQVRALNAMAGFDHDDRFVDPLDGAVRTLLRQLQSDVLRRASRPARDGARDCDLVADDSLMLLEHASIRREMEAVASEIWRLCETHPDLRFDEIAVLVPEVDGAEYLAQLPTVFREAHSIPYQTVGIAMPGDNRILEGIGLLLALPLGRYTREELLRVAIHPCIASAFNDVDPERWVGWCDALGVVHGADRRDHEGTYIQRDILNWDQGLRRLALGCLMAGDAAGDRRPFEMAADAYAPYEVALSDTHDAASFGLLVQSLLADARFARDAELTILDWSTFLEALVRTYVVPTSGVEEEQLSACLRRLHGVGRMDVGARPVRYRIACELAREKLAAVGAGRGGEGVVVSTLSAARPLPFRVVFACGMGEGRFPAPEADDPLDLRGASRRTADVSARERDRYAFLELLLGARDRLIASYVSRDAVTGDGLAPSSVVQELTHLLAQGYAARPRRVTHPLRRWDPDYFPDLFPSAGHASSIGTICLAEARAEARSLALRLDAEAAGARPLVSDVRARATTESAWGLLADHLGLPRLPAGSAKAEGRIVVPLSALVKFLEFPIQGWARFRLGLDEMEGDDVMAREDEPFETAARDETVFLRGVLLEAAATGRSLAEAYDEEVERRELRGAGPSGLFARSERATHVATMESWQREMARVGVDLADIQVHRFGRAGEHASAHRVHDALTVDVDVVDAAGVTRLVRAEIGGRTQPMGNDAGTSLTLLKRAAEWRDDEWSQAERGRIALRAFVEHAVLSASGVAEQRPHGSLVVIGTADETSQEHCVFGALSRDQASAWLRNVLRDLLGGAHAYFLPCEAVLAWSRGDPGSTLATWIESARERLGDSDDRSALRSSYGPVPSPSDYPAPDESTLRTIVARRFGLIFEKSEPRQ